MLACLLPVALSFGLAPPPVADGVDMSKDRHAMSSNVAEEILLSCLTAGNLSIGRPNLMEPAYTPGMRHADLTCQTLTLTLTQPASKWMHWATLRRHSCLPRAATSASSQVNVIFRRSFLAVPVQLALGRPGPLLKPGTSQYSACCGIRWWSIAHTCQTANPNS